MTMPGSWRSRPGQREGHPWLLGTRQGVLDLRTATLRPGQPDEHFPPAIPTVWKGLDEPAPRFEQFLRDILADRAEAEREELVAFLQRVLGYGITGNVNERIFLMLYGAQENNGAPMLMHVLAHVLGKTVGMLPADFLTSSGHAVPSCLQGKRIVWTTERNGAACLPAEQLKRLTDGEALPVRQLYSREHHFTPTHLLVVLTTLSPAGRQMESLGHERLCLLPLNLHFVAHPARANERQADPALKAALEAEASGILAWLVRGTLEWIRLGLAIPASVRQLAQQPDAPNSIQDFIDQCCIREAAARVAAHQLYQHYRQWATQQQTTPLSNKQFGRALKQLGDITSLRGRRGAVYAGIRLTQEGEETHEDSADMSHP